MTWQLIPALTDPRNRSPRSHSNSRTANACSMSSSPCASAIAISNSRSSWTIPASGGFAGGGGTSPEDFSEELFELGAGEAAGFVATDFPTLKGVEVEAPSLRGLRLGEADLIAGEFDALGDGHGIAFWLC